MRILQVLTTISYGDAVGNDVFAIHDTLKKMGHETAIYAENIGKRVDTDICHYIDELPQLTDKDIIIYHLSTGTHLNYSISKYPGRKIIIYHNITPPEYFAEYSDFAKSLCEEGYKGLKHLSEKADYCIADSQYNKADMIKYGYHCDIDVLPILIPFSDYDKPANKDILSKYKDDGYTNILFTGRIAPNKKQEDVILSYYHYKKYYNAKSRLFLVGNYEGMESYYERLKAYAEKLELEDIVFTGHIGFDEILAYYKLADVFLCESEHEGFCVPLVEAMYFKVPVIAYDAAAVGETLGNGGILIEEKNHLEIAGIINKVVSDADLRTKMINNQSERLEDFAHDKIENKLECLINKFIAR